MAYNLVVAALAMDQMTILTIAGTGKSSEFLDDNKSMAESLYATAVKMEMLIRSKRVVIIRSDFLQ
jgi:hypothetical protein